MDAIRGAFKGNGLLTRRAELLLDEPRRLHGSTTRKQRGPIQGSRLAAGSQGHAARDTHTLQTRALEAVTPREWAHAGEPTPRGATAFVEVISETGQRGGADEHDRDEYCNARDPSSRGPLIEARRAVRAMGLRGVLAGSER